MKEKQKKPFYKKWWVWLIAIIIVIGFLNDSNDGQSETKDTSAEAQNQEDKQDKTKETEKEKEQEEVKSFGIGDPADVADVTFTVNSVEATTEINSNNEFIDNATTSGQFIILNVTIKNEKKEAITIDSSFFTLIDGDTKYEPVTDYEVLMALPDAEDFFLTQINPNLDKTGDVVIETAADLNLDEAILQAQTGFFGTEKVDISLAK